MISKKEQILNTALELFASEGYKAVPTIKIAKTAKVSEGLIFRHFDSKQGLLDAIVEQAIEKTKTLFKPIISEKTPKRVIEKAIELPFLVEENEYHFWKLQFKLKWELEYPSIEKMKPLIDKLTWAFSELDYKEPLREAEILSHVIESISGAILKDGLESQQPLMQFLLKKYIT
jgi:AcrR family transcriptional regulator